MWEDLERGRRTEIDYLQGVITEIADRRGLKVPLSRRIVALIREAEAERKGSPRLTVEQIRCRAFQKARPPDRNVSCACPCSATARTAPS